MEENQFNSNGQPPQPPPQQSMQQSMQQVLPKTAEFCKNVFASRKNIAIFASVCVAVIALIACLLYFCFRSSPLPEYAPADSQIIVYMDNGKIADSRLFQELYEMCEAEFPQEVNMGKMEVRNQIGVEWEDLLNSSGCVFLHVKTPERWYRNDVDVDAIGEFKDVNVIQVMDKIAWILSENR